MDREKRGFIHLWEEMRMKDERYFRETSKDQNERGRRKEGRKEARKACRLFPVRKPV